MAETLKLESVTPQAIVFSDDVHMVTLPAIEGEMGIYPQHERLITQVVPGELLITKDGADTILAIGEGLVEVTATHVSILTDMAIRAEHIDEAAVQEARDRAQARLREKISDEEIASVNASMVRALAQLQVKRRQRTRG
jgi:F-type H+-transporting ATPase subunit epsilon